MPVGFAGHVLLLPRPVHGAGSACECGQHALIEADQVPVPAAADHRVAVGDPAGRGAHQGAVAHYVAVHPGGVGHALVDLFHGEHGVEFLFHQRLADQGDRGSRHDRNPALLVEQGPDGHPPVGQAEELVPRVSPASTGSPSAAPRPSASVVTAGSGWAHRSGRLIDSPVNGRSSAGTSSAGPPRWSTRNRIRTLAPAAFTGRPSRCTVRLTLNASSPASAFGLGTTCAVTRSSMWNAEPILVSSSTNSTHRPWSSYSARAGMPDCRKWSSTASSTR